MAKIWTTVLIEKEASVFDLHLSSKMSRRFCCSMSRIDIGYTGKKNGIVELERDIWLEPATGFVTKNCTTVQGSGLNTIHKWRMQLNKDISCKEETEVMGVSFVVRNERVYIADTSAKDGIG